MLISRVHFPVTTLGWGRRVGVWTQGCSIGCLRCMSRDTWDADATKDVPVEEILRVVGDCGPVDGVTISGGEPLDQHDELVRLIAGLREALPPRADVLCYSGRSRSTVERRYRDVLDGVDALVVGPYVWQKGWDDPLRGSSNQEILCTTALGIERYGDDAARRRSHLNVGIAQERIRLIGVPAPGDLVALEAAAEAAGLQISGASWSTGEEPSP